MADKVIVLTKGPAVVKKIYKIQLDKRDIPTNNRKDKMYDYYYELISQDLNV